MLKKTFIFYRYFIHCAIKYKKALPGFPRVEHVSDASMLAEK